MLKDYCLLELRAHHFHEVERACVKVELRLFAKIIKLWLFIRRGRVKRSF